MSLSQKLAALAEAGKPIRVGVIGAGKFGSMFLSQAPRTKGMHVMGIADLDVSRARDAVARVGWPAERASAGVVHKTIVDAGTPGGLGKRPFTVLIPGSRSCPSS